MVHVDREPGRRIIREVLQLNGYDRSKQSFQMEPVFRAESHSIAEVKPC